MLIAVGNNHFAQVDGEDYPSVSKYRWSLDKGYAYGYVMIDGKKYHRYMHNFLLSPPKGLVVDHINWDRLDNRRENLRICTRKENNGHRQQRGTVYWDKNKKRWTLQYKHQFIGRYKSKEEAELARLKL